MSPACFDPVLPLTSTRQSCNDITWQACLADAAKYAVAKGPHPAKRLLVMMSIFEVVSTHADNSLECRRESKWGTSRPKRERKKKKRRVDRLFHSFGFHTVQMPCVCRWAREDEVCSQRSCALSLATERPLMQAGACVSCASFPMKGAHLALLHTWFARSLKYLHAASKRQSRNVNQQQAFVCCQALHRLCPSAASQGVCH